MLVVGSGRTVRAAGATGPSVPPPPPPLCTRACLQLVTPEQYAIIIDSFVRGLPGVDLPPQSTSTPLDALYQKYLEDAGLNPEVAEALSNDEVSLAEELVGQHQKRLNGEKKQASGSGSSGGAAAAAAAASAPTTPATPARAGPLATITINGEVSGASISVDGWLLFRLQRALPA